MTQNRNGDLGGLVLRDVRVDRFDLRWEFRACLPDPKVLVVRSTRNGLITDVQQLGPVHKEIELPPEMVGAISERITEELVRARLVAILQNAPDHSYERRGERAA